MPNKYCNLDGTKKIKDEYKKINIGFDKVEEDLVNIIVTPAEGVSEQEIIQARKGKATLNDRLNEIDTNINTVNNNLNSRIDNIIATPTTVSEQEIIDARQGKASLGANLTAIKEEVRGMLSRTKNLFDGSYIKDAVISYATTPRSLYRQIGGRTAVIPITTDGSKIYHINKVEPTSRFVVSGCIDEPVFSDVLGQNTTDYDYIRRMTTETNYFTIQPTSDVKYLVIQVSINHEEPKLSVSVHENSTFQDFIPYFEIDENFIPKELIDDLTFSTVNIKNFRNGNILLKTGEPYEQDADKRVLSPLIAISKGSTINTIDQSEIDGFYGIFFDKNSGEWIGNTGGYVYSYVIQEDCYVRLLSRYTDLRVITNPSEFDTRFEIIKKTCSDENFIPKELIDDLTFSTVNIKNFRNGNIYVNTGEPYEQDADKRVLSPLIAIAKGSTINTIDQSEIDGFYGIFFDKNSGEWIGNTGGYVYRWEIQEDCYVRLLSRYTDLRVITNPSEFDTRFEIIKPYSSDTNKKQTLFGNFQTLYKTPDCEDMRETLTEKTINDIYNEYDNLMSDFPNQIEKNLLGYGTLNGGGEDNTLPIYEYTFKNPSSSLLSYRSPTILIQTGLHGNEKSPVWSLLQFLKQMMYGSLDNDTLDAIKNAGIYRIIPIANPGGFNANTRKNNNNVNINRNFGYKWETYVSEEKGVSAYSEEETKILRDWYLEYASDDTFFIDFHNTSEAYNSSYLDTPNAILAKEYSQMMIRLSGRWIQRYNEVGNKEIPNEAYGFLLNSQAPMAQNEAYYIAGIKNSALLEIAWDDNGVKYTSKVIERGVDLVANYIQILLRMF